VQRFRHLERVDRPRHAVGGAFLNKEAAVEEHPHGLDRVEGDAFGTREDPVAYLRGEPRHEPGQQLLHRLLRERLQVERAEAALPGAPGRPPLEQLRPRQCDHEDRRASRPVEQVLDEVEQARVRPLHVLESQHSRIALGQALEEQPPGGEQVLLVAGMVLGQPEHELLRLLVVPAEHLNARVDYGIGSDSKQIYFSILEAF